MNANSAQRSLVSRIALFISRLITRIAPPLHSIHWKVFILFMLVLLVPLGVVGFKIRGSIETGHLYSTEEGMIDTATIVAELCARLMVDLGDDPQRLGDELRRVFANLDRTYQIKAGLFGFRKNEVDTRFLVFDRTGHIVFDTSKATKIGDDFSSWIDVSEALRGKYGSRWELDHAYNRVNLYSTVPVFVNHKVVGAVSVSKSTNRVRNFIVRQLKLLTVPFALAVAMAAVFAFLLSGYITRTVAGLASKADRIASGEQGVKLETWSKSELGALARSVEKMRRKLEGKAYIEEMATTLSHELKTPLASIRGAAELLEDGAVRDEATRAKFLGNIQSEVHRLDRIVNDLLKLSRLETHPEPAPAEPVDAAAIVRDSGETYRSRAENVGIAFSCESPLTPLEIRVSEAALRQMLANLLDNALQFTPAGGAVTLALARIETHAEIRVRDTGAGIETDLLPKIFDRFFTTKNPRTGNRGTGLGLAIVKSIVEQNRGTIRAESTPGKGAEFIVALPVA